MLANTSTGMSAEFTTSARNSLTLTELSSPLLVWWRSKSENTRVNVPSATFNTAVNALVARP